MSADLSNGFALAEDRPTEEYRLQTGDVIGFSVVGNPEMQKEAVVDQSGTIVLPVVGSLNVFKKTIEDVRKQVIDGLKPKSLPQRAVDGSENWTGFYPDQIVVDIKEYRPVYIDGDIATPGVQTFRPGMTVRQAVAAGGGYQIADDLENPELREADLRGQLDVLRAKYQESEIIAARIEAQLAGATAVEIPAATDSSFASRRAEALQHEQKRLEAYYDDQKKERASIELAKTKAAERMKYLEEQQDTDRKGADADADELKRIKALSDKGLVQITRVNDAQRAVLLSATRALETNAEIAQLERDQGELERSLEKLVDQSRIDLLAELQTERAEMTQARAEMDALAKQITYVTQRRSDLVGQDGSQVSINVTRSYDGQTTSIEATEDTLLSPGDTVTVTLQVEPETTVGN